jgi:DNA-binding NarL/FixJ family response regulator
MASGNSVRWGPAKGETGEDSGLEAIGGPALIVGLGGEVLQANAAAQVLLDRDEMAVRNALANLVAGNVTEHVWDLTLLRNADTPLGFLALLRPRPHEGKLDDAVREATRVWKLSSRQRQVLGLVAQGFTNALVAETLEIGARTVEFHVSAIFDKAGVENRAMLMAKLFDL